MWFLDEIPSQTAILYYNLPKGKAILTEILAGECDYLDDASVKTEAVRVKCALSGMQGGTMKVTVDEKDLKDIGAYWVESTLFNFTIPADNGLDATAVGTTQAKAVGYYLFLEPLPAGKHIIHEYYSIIDNPSLGTPMIHSQSMIRQYGCGC